jgi:hypothetical protein
MPLVTSFNSISSISKSAQNSVNIVGGSNASATYNGKVYNYRRLLGAQTTTFEIYGSGFFDMFLLGGGGAGGGVQSVNRSRAGGGGGGGGCYILNNVSIANGYAYAEVIVGAGGVSSSSSRVSGGNTVVTFYTDSTKTTTIASVTAYGGGGGGVAPFTSNPGGATSIGSGQGNLAAGAGVTCTTTGSITSNISSPFYFTSSPGTYRDFSISISLQTSTRQGGRSTAGFVNAFGGGGGGLGSANERLGYDFNSVVSGDFTYPIFGAETYICNGGDGGISTSPGIANSVAGYGNGGGGLGRANTNTASGVGGNGTDGAFAFIYER